MIKSKYSVFKPLLAVLFSSALLFAQEASANSFNDFQCGVGLTQKTISLTPNSDTGYNAHKLYDTNQYQGWSTGIVDRTVQAKLQLDNPAKIKEVHIFINQFMNSSGNMLFKLLDSAGNVLETNNVDAHTSGWNTQAVNTASSNVATIQVYSNPGQEIFELRVCATDNPPPPPHATFAEVIGFNGGIHMGDTDTPRYQTISAKASIFQRHRYFRLYNHDSHVDENLYPISTGYQCPNVSQGWQTGTAAWQYRECSYDNKWSVNHAALEAIYWPSYKQYPNKSLTQSDMGGNPYVFGYKYGTVLKNDESQMIDVLQVSNEPHGSPSYAVMNQFAKGMKDAIGNSMKLCSPDIQNTGEDKFGGQVLHNQLSKMDISLYDVLDVHSYQFDNAFKLSIAPEKVTSLWMSPYREMKDMQPFASSHELVLGEFGYDSKVLGEETQAAYIVRTIYHAMRFGFSGAYVYNITDDPNAAPFDYTGILKHDGQAKISYNMLKTLVTTYGDYYFDSVIQDNGTNFTYRFTNGSDSFDLSWNINDTSIPMP